MKNLLVLIALLLFEPAAARAAWAKVVIGEFPADITGAVIGRLDGAQTLALTSGGGTLHLLKWDNTEFKRSDTVVPGGSSSASMAILPGHDDGVNRLYIGRYNTPWLLELTPQNGKLAYHEIQLPGIGTEGLQGTVSHIDREARLFPNVKFAGPIISSDTNCSNNANNFKLYECAWAADKWTCGVISEPCRGPFVVNPPGPRDYDVILGLYKVLVRKPRSNWEKVGRFSGGRYMLSSQEGNDRVYTDMWRNVFNADFSRSIREKIWEAPSSFCSIAAGRTHPEPVEYVYFGAEDAHIYESVRSTYSWRTSDLGKAEGLPRYLLAGDLREDGIPRLYVVTGRTLSEYAYYQEKTALAVLDFEVKNSSGRADTSAGATLGNLFRSKLSTYEHLNVLEGANMDKILAERKFQSTNCADGDCAAALGTLLKAQVVLTGTVMKRKDDYAVLLQAFDSRSGHPILTLNAHVENETGILDALGSLAKECALRWPHTIGTGK